MKCLPVLFLTELNLYAKFERKHKNIQNITIISYISKFMLFCQKCNIFKHRKIGTISFLYFSFEKGNIKFIFINKRKFNELLNKEFQSFLYNFFDELKSK